MAGPAIQYTQADWAAQVLSDANLPTTQNNVQNIERWMVAEEPPSHWWNRNNPLNASLGTSASDGTAGYTDLATAAAYTARMIQQTNMAGIYNALKANADVNTFSAAVVASPWASGHYGGSPNAIANILVPTATPASVNPGTTNLVAVNNAAASSSTGPGLTIPNPLDGGATSITLLSGQAELKIKGWTLMIAGGLVATVGMAIVLTAFGLESKVGRLVSAVPGGRAVRAGATAAGGAASSAPPPPSPSAAFQGGMREAEYRESDRQRAAAEADIGPIGPRGGVQGQAARARRGVSVEGAPRRRTEEQRRRARERAAQPF